MSWLIPYVTCSKTQMPMEVIIRLVKWLKTALCPNHGQRCQKDTCFKTHKYLKTWVLKSQGCWKDKCVEKTWVSKRQGCRKDKGVEKTRVSKRQGCRKDKGVKKTRVSKRKGCQKEKGVKKTRVSKRQGCRKLYHHTTQRGTCRGTNTPPGFLLYDTCLMLCFFFLDNLFSSRFIF